MIDVGLLCCVLVWVSLLALLLNVKSYPEGLRWLTAGVLALLMAIPVNQLSLVSYPRGYHGDFSFSTVVLLVACLSHQVSGRRLIASKHMAPLSVAVAAIAIVFYPSSLGAAPFNLYNLGYQTEGMLLVMAILSLIASATRCYLCALLLIVAALGHSFQLLESSNIWDYLIDPFLALYCIFSCVVQYCKQRINKPAIADRA